MKSNIILGTDSYKFSHFYQDPPNTSLKQSHVVARNNKSFAAKYVDNVTFFGLQAWMLERLTRRVTIEDVNEAENFAKLHGVPFNREGWMRIVNHHGGFLPIRICSLPEGSQVPIGVAQVVVENTDPQLPWLTAYVETELLRAVWYPSTVATNSRAAKKMLWKYLETTSDDPAGQINFKLHDFGQRGASSRESAALGGMAHLINFSGTDTTEGVLAIDSYYNDGGRLENICGFSIPAMEHSTVTIWGRENEGQAYSNMIEKSPGPLVACVADSYDVYNAADVIFGQQLHDQIVNSGKTVVFRPDSGDPLTVVPHVIELLALRFGTQRNSKGYDVLNNVRIIQGDGVDLDVIEKILFKLERSKFSADNIAFGMGAGLLQNVNRDTFGYAMKCNYAEVDNQSVDVYKDPVTDHRKQSWKGPIDVVGWNGQYLNVKQYIVPSKSALVLRYDSGRIGKLYNFSEVRENAKI